MDTIDNENTSKQKPRDKISILEFFLLLASFLCFIGALAFLLQRSFLLSLGFIILHGFLTPINLLLSRKGLTIKEVTSPSEELVPKPAKSTMELIEHDNSLISKLRKEKDQLSYENEQLSGELDKSSNQVNTLTQLLAEAELKSVEALDPRLAASILPREEYVEDLDLIALSQRIVNQMQATCAAAGVRLELSTSSTAINYQADKRYISLMIRNIIDNSIKYMKRNGTLVITISNVGANIFIAFKDDGLGLPEKELPNIFDLNFQGSNRVSGNGLGLAQVKAIVEHYDGTIYAHSSNGMGIYIHLPVNS